MVRNGVTMAALLGMLGSAAAGKSCSTCSEQAPCLNLEVTKDSDYANDCDLSGACTYTACMTLNTDNDSCNKQGKTFSYCSDKSMDDSCPNSGTPANWDDTPAWDKSKYTQCQSGNAGDTLYFAFKDGSHCSDAGTYDLDHSDDGVEYAYCAPADSEVAHSGGKGAECTWTVTLPECSVCEDGSEMCGDPHLAGLRGQHFFWSGVDGGWYSLLKEDTDGTQINVRVTAPSKDFPLRQYATGVSVLSEGHSVVIEVKDPYTVETQGCSGGVYPCLADGGVRVLQDGVEMAELQAPLDREVMAGGIKLSSSNLPSECQHFNRHRTWAKENDASASRNLAEDSFEQWLLNFEETVPSDWCSKFIKDYSLATVQSKYTIFRIETPSVTIRVVLGIDHENAGFKTYDGRVLPDLDLWRMDIGVEGLTAQQEDSLFGILGETARPVLDDEGRMITTGRKAMRGMPQEYRVAGPTGTDFTMMHTEH